MEMIIKKVNKNNINEVSRILTKAAKWLISEDMKNWDPSRFTVGKMLKHNNLDELFLCYVGDEAAGCLKLQERDEKFWPDDEPGDALYVHRLAVRRKYAGHGISVFMLNWAKEQARIRECRHIKLDCLSDREKLCKFYVGQGFTKVNECLVFGKYPTAFFECRIGNNLSY